MELRVLGPVEVVGTQGPGSLAAPKHLRLLAALAIRPGESFSSDALIDAVWGTAPPPSARKVLQVYVSQLRKHLSPPLAISTRGPGYVLELDDGAFDAARFERLLNEGRAAAVEGNHRLAASLLGRALGLWRGPAYGEFSYEEFARPEAERLEELRLVAREQRIDAELALGHEAAVLPELCSFAREYPLRERLQAQAMLALYRCGRQTEALEVYAGAHARLRDELGLDPGAELRELQQRILQQDAGLNPVPRIASGAASSAAVPAAPNALLGRERELAELRDVLLGQDARLLVLSGAGGSGKTRLALEAAREAEASFANGVVFVALAPLRDPGLVIGAIAQACGLHDVGGDDQLQTLVAALRARQMLLVLDNFEHVRAAAPSVVDLLAGAPRVTALVTSRAVLHLSGERVYPVQPLAVDAACELFDERAREADPRFAVDAAAERAIAQICSRLDGLPLAIELAAARTTVLTPVELLERLDPRLPLLTSGPRDLPARQQTLRATLEWSHDLLAEGERRLFRRLSVFAGGFDLAAVEGVCEGDLDTLGSLLEQSLVTRWAGGRLGMLETVRELAAEHLATCGEAHATRARHAAYFLALARSANLLEESGAEARFDLVFREHDNIRVAIGWALDSGEVELGLNLATALEAFWCMNVPLEGVQWLETLLTRDRGVPLEARARALQACGTVTVWAHDLRRAEALWEKSLSAYRAMGDERGAGRVLQCLAANARDLGDIVRARNLIDQSVEILHRLGTKIEQSQALAILGKIECDEGNPDLGMESLERAAAVAGEHGSWFWQMWWSIELCERALYRGMTEACEAWGRRVLALCRKIGDRQTPLATLTLLALAALEDGRLDHAGRLWGSAEAAATATATPGWWLLPDDPDFPGFGREAFESDLRACHDPEFERGREQGRRLPLDDAISYVLGSDVSQGRPETTRLR
jgi:predicted ATPase/DNA-binding SARP family transcriptional activator